MMSLIRYDDNGQDKGGAVWHQNTALWARKRLKSIRRVKSSRLEMEKGKKGKKKGKRQRGY
jgi:hypothetical protein